MELPKCGFFVALIACLGIVCTEGRPFWPRNHKPADQLMHTIEASYKLRELGEQRSQLATPTNQNIASSADHHSASAAAAAGGTSTTTAAHNKDDFRPTPPGNSPGVGHKLFAQASHRHVEPPTAVGGSPSSGKNFGKTGTTDDYRPTMPGHSPGAGHKLFAEASHRRVEPPKAVDGGPSGGKNFGKTGTKDDHRPTMPGHSPGVGHAYHLQNADQTNA